jgi:DNA-binding MarR family transcriptional regulator
VLRRVLRRLFRFGSLLEPHDHGGVQVSMSEVMALGELSDAEGMSQQSLGELLGLEKSTVSRLVSGLEERGWLSRERDPANRRFVRLGLTDEGRRVAERIGQDLTADHRLLLAELTDDEQQALMVGLTALARALERHRHHAPRQDGEHPGHGPGTG